MAHARSGPYSAVPVGRSADPEENKEKKGYDSWSTSMVVGFVVLAGAIVLALILAIIALVGMGANAANIHNMGAIKVCDPGEMPVNSTCVACPVGTHGFGASDCVPCQHGSYASLTGTITCILCAGGTYQDMFGQAECMSCPIGTTSYSGSAALEDCFAPVTMSTIPVCPPGQVLVNAYAEYPAEPIPAGWTPDCDACPEGTWSDGTLIGVCTDCAEGYATCDPDHGHAETCDAGYGYDDGDCIACADLFYTLGGVDPCVACITNCATCSPTLGECSECDAGFGYLAGTCTECLPLTFSLGDTECLACVDDCATCTATTGVCTACDTGFVLNGLVCDAVIP